jgi:hypothetical protein
MMGVDKIVENDKPNKHSINRMKESKKVIPQLVLILISIAITTMTARRRG